MRLSTRPYLAVCFTAFFLSGYSVAGAQGIFHVPQSEAENALDNILLHAAHDQNFVNYALDFPDRYKGNDGEFSTFVTHGFAASVAELQKQEVEDNCGGQYKDGEECGLDINPFTCKSDYSYGRPLYVTEKQKKNTATINAVWTGQDPEIPETKYKLIKDRKGWRLDGVLCFGETSFNLK